VLAGGCGAAPKLARHSALAAPARASRRRQRFRLRHPLRLSSHAELRRHPREVLELRGSGTGRRRPPAHPARLAEDAVTGVRTRRRMVALSFDDGPNPLYTPTVLSLLRAYGAHATFFAIGMNALRWPSLIRDELGAGDEVGEHTFDHPHLPALPQRAIALELGDATRALASYGAAVRLFRPPYGQFDARVAALAVHERQRIVLWSLNLERLEQFESPLNAARRVLARVRPGDVILCHDGVPPPLAALAAHFVRRAGAMVRNRQLSRRGTLSALPVLLAGLRRRGYEIVTVSTLLGSGPAIQQGLDAINDPWAYRRTLRSDRGAVER
jgi:peptidoglycan-N-acetylglucosamine deacetylase